MQVPAMDTHITAFSGRGQFSYQVEKSAQEVPCERTTKSAIAEPAPPWHPSHEAELPCMAMALRGLVAPELAAAAGLPRSTTGSAMSTVSSSVGTTPSRGRILLFHE